MIFSTSFPKGCCGCGVIGGASDGICGGGFPRGVDCIGRLLKSKGCAVTSLDEKFGLRMGVIGGLRLCPGGAGAEGLGI